MDKLDELKSLEAITDSLDVSESDDSDEDEEDPLSVEPISVLEKVPQSKDAEGSNLKSLKVSNETQSSLEDAKKIEPLKELFLSVDKRQYLSKKDLSDSDEDDGDDDDEDEDDDEDQNNEMEEEQSNQAGGTLGQSVHLELITEREDTEEIHYTDDRDFYVLSKTKRQTNYKNTEIDNDEMEDLESEEDDEEEEEDKENLVPNDENLDFLNNNYKDYLSNVLSTLTKELQNNLGRQQDIAQILEEKEGDLSKASKASINQHVAVTKKTLSLFGFPYFKDAQMYHPPPNLDTVKKRQNMELDVWVEYPRSWNQQESKALTTAVRREARRKRLWRIYEEKEELEHRLKQIGLRDEEREELEESYRVLNFRIKEILKIPDDKLFEDREEEFDWMRIAAGDLKMFHSPLECCLHWKNLAHTTLNRSPWTPEEDGLLKRFADATECREWDSIASEMCTGRTAIACYSRFMQKHHILENNRSWTAKEDDKLRRLVALSRLNNYIPWAKVTYFMDRRTKEQCYQRYAYSLRESIRHGSWSPAEQWILIVAEQMCGRDWVKISDLICTRTAMQIHAHYRNYLKTQFKAWAMEDDVILLESVKKLGLRNWVAVAKVFNDESRDRTKCRQRFEMIYKKFKMVPNKAIELELYDSNRNALKKRAQALDSFAVKFQDWIGKMDEEPVVSNIPVPCVNLDDYSTLPNGSKVKNRILSKFVRHAQTLLPIVVPRPLERLPPPRLRKLPDDDLGPLHLRPLNLAQLIKRKRSFIGVRGRPKIRQMATKVEPVHPSNVATKTVMDREISRLFWPTYLAKPSRSASQHSQEELGLLNIAAHNMDQLLDFSSLKSNLNPEKIDKCSSSERQVLESYRFQSDITESEPEPANVKSGGKRSKTYSRRRDEDDPAMVPCPQAPESLGLNLLMPNQSTLRTFRGALLHADYTAELALPLEPELVAVHRKKTPGNAQRVIRMGVDNPDIVRRAQVGYSLFSSLKDARRSELEESREQIAADQKLVERMVKLLYWPARMSVITPADQEVLFLNDSDVEEDDSVCAANPYESSDLETSLAGLRSNAAPTAKNAGRTLIPASNASYVNLPSVMSMYSDCASSPATPATRTYSRKRPAPKLGLNFQDLLNPPKKAGHAPGGAGGIL